MWARPRQRSAPDPQHRTGEQQTQHRVQPEDGPPVSDDEDEGAEHRAEHGPEFLHRPDDTQGYPAPVRRPELGDDGQGGRHEASSADALDHPAGHEHGQLDGQGGDHRPDDEDPQAGEQHPLAVDEVGQPTDEGQHRDVAEQEARDDRCRPLEGVDAHPDTAHHVGQGEDDDIGVGGGEGDGDGSRREQCPRGG